MTRPIAFLLCLVLAAQPALSQVKGALPSGVEAAPAAFAFPTITPELQGEIEFVLTNRFEFAPLDQMEAYDLSVLTKQYKDARSGPIMKAACGVALRALSIPPKSWTEAMKAAFPPKLRDSLLEKAETLHHAASHDPDLASSVAELRRELAVERVEAVAKAWRVAEAGSAPATTEAPKEEEFRPLDWNAAVKHRRGSDLNNLTYVFFLVQKAALVDSAKEVLNADLREPVSDDARHRLAQGLQVLSQTLSEYGNLAEEDRNLVGMELGWVNYAASKVVKALGSIEGSKVLHRKELEAIERAPFASEEVKERARSVLADTKGTPVLAPLAAMTRGNVQILKALWGPVIDRFREQRTRRTLAAFCIPLGLGIAFAWIDYYPLTLVSLALAYLLRVLVGRRENKKLSEAAAKRELESSPEYQAALKELDEEFPANVRIEALPAEETAEDEGEPGSGSRLAK